MNIPEKSLPFFEAVNIKKSFGRFTALKNINMRLNMGDFVTIFGENGAGKTTFLKIASTVMFPSEGTIRLKGQDIKDAGAGLRAQLGYIAHDTFLYKNLTARENLKFYGTMYGVKDINKVVNQTLKSVGLNKRADDPVRGFSRGMLQRLAIARAFIHNPPLMLLDEPYTGLDTHAADFLNNLLKSFITDDRTCVMTTHNIDQGFDIATHVAILHKGQIHYFSATKDISKRDFKEMFVTLIKQS